MIPQNTNVSRRELLAGGALALTGLGAGDRTGSAQTVSFARHDVGKDGDKTLRVAACQVLLGPDVRKSAETVLQWLQRAAAENCDVVAFPEACLCGYAGDEYWKSARPEEFAEAESLVVDASRRLGIAVVLGTVHWESDKIFNDLLVIDKGGLVRGRYSKTHLAERWSSPGKTLPVYEVCGVPSCFIICHDVRYPELVRLPAAAGAQICYFCSHESGLASEYKLSAYRAMPITRATENSIFCIMANAPADPKTLEGSHGNSKIIHPDGNVLAEASYFEQRLVIADIRINDANRAMALRAINDETLLKSWLRDGTKLVTIQKP